LVLEENSRRWHQWWWIGWKEGTSNLEYISKIGENISFSSLLFNFFPLDYNSVDNLVSG
jgi:hypothetical protein